MKKRKNQSKIDCVPIQNLVAKFAHQINKAHVFADKNKYRRNAKHRKQEASPMALIRVIGETSRVLAEGLRGYCLMKTFHGDRAFFQNKQRLYVKQRLYLPCGERGF